MIMSNETGNKQEEIFVGHALEQNIEDQLIKSGYIRLQIDILL